MTAILELREKRAKAWDAAKNFLDSKRGNDGMMSAEDAATYVAKLMEGGMSRKDAIKQTAKELDLPKNVVYDAALAYSES